MKMASVAGPRDTRCFLCQTEFRSVSMMSMLRKRVDSVTKELLDLIGGGLVMEPWTK